VVRLVPADTDPGGGRPVRVRHAARHARTSEPRPPGLFGSRLAGVYAPEVLASFGTGTARVDVRVVAPDGSARYRQALAADLRSRRAAGQPPRVTGFGAADPGAGPGLPVRTVRLAASGGTARRMLAFLRAQRSPYQPGYVGAAGSAVTVEFAAPAPLGLLGNQ